MTPFSANKSSQISSLMANPIRFILIREFRYLHLKPVALHRLDVRYAPKGILKVKTLLPMDLLTYDRSTVAGVLRILLRDTRTVSSIFISES